MAELHISLDSIPASVRGCAVAVGNFDGVHRGHAKLIKKLVQLAGHVGGASVVMTFDPPPQAILTPPRSLAPPLTTVPRRAELLGCLGVDAVIAYPTDRELLELTPVQFFEHLICRRLQARGMVEGPNFRFGKDRAGNTQLLRQLCEQAGMRFELASATTDCDGMISSTRIRGLLAAGEISSVNSMLTQPYQIRGTVAEGAGRGRQLGFPTANLIDIGCLLPAHGVYAGRTTIDGQSYPVAINIGPNPTFDEETSKVEAHLIDWQGRLYGQQLTCNLLVRIRGVEKFSSVEALRQQIAQDVAACRTTHRQLAAHD